MQKISKRYYSIFYLVLLSNLFSFCSEKKSYPNLISEEIKYSDDDFSKQKFSDYLVYKKTTTKEIKKSTTIKSTDKKHPWDNAYSEEKANSILNEIASTITPMADNYSDDQLTPANSIRLSGLVNNFTKSQMKEYKEKDHITTEKSGLDLINAKISKYELINEKNEKIVLDSDFLKINLGGLEEKNGKVLEGIGFETMSMGKFEFFKINGFIDIEVSLPTEYEIEEFTKEDIGKNITIDNAKIKLIEFDGDVFHFEKDATIENEFDFYLEGISQNYNTIEVPKSIYEKFRNNQGLNYVEFIKKYSTFGINDSKLKLEKEHVCIVRADDNLKKVYLYAPSKKKVISKIIHIPVAISVK
ncbi:hypothetical protein JJC03_03485 [Flavobacterium oreochromis]|uniref:hypothetical protein n=1 Tax=Flavobacterium oreochromis TaxID=2906078 RepID=UPI001CE4CF63|nr:hypothetical protein [Flavobacterium oreochromis]QYS87045.1 hypothetical protein JJC03_03485 [Flavobacterium oreochromis]